MKPYECDWCQDQGCFEWHDAEGNQGRYILATYADELLKIRSASEHERAV